MNVPTPNGGGTSRFEPGKAPAPVRGVSWQYDGESGEWIRFMMRVYSDATPYWSRTYRLMDPDLPFCMQCLSINVTFEKVDDNGSTDWRCHDCDIGTFRISSL